MKKVKKNKMEPRVTYRCACPFETHQLGDAQAVCLPFKARLCRVTYFQDLQDHMHDTGTYLIMKGIHYNKPKNTFLYKFEVI